MLRHLELLLTKREGLRAVQDPEDQGLSRTECVRTTDPEAQRAILLHDQLVAPWRLRETTTRITPDRGLGGDCGRVEPDLEVLGHVVTVSGSRHGANVVGSVEPADLYEDLWLLALDGDHLPLLVHIRREGTVVWEDHGLVGGKDAELVQDGPTGPWLRGLDLLVLLVLFLLLLLFLVLLLLGLGGRWRRRRCSLLALPGAFCRHGWRGSERRLLFAHWHLLCLRRCG